jgi:tripartite-type tricarboxylate transporter receptor subunit TctC
MLSASHSFAVCTAISVAIAASGGVAAEISVAEFYRRTPLTLVVGSDVTGDYDAAARLLSRHLGRHIPGNPNVVVQNMPGASGIKAANWLYAVAPRDGSVIGTFNKSMPFYEVTGTANVNYKSNQFSWIGSSTWSNNLVVVTARTGIKTIEDAKLRSVTMGSIGAGGTMSTYPLMLNNTVGTKFKLVQGYAGGQMVDLAMERGEVDGRGSYTWADLKARRSDWLKQGKLNVLVQFGLEREADLADAPLAMELARDATERAAFAFISADIAIGKPFVLPPEPPAERIVALRKAFADTMKDPDYLADAKTVEAEVKPTPGVTLQKIVADIIATSPDVLKLSKKLMSEN